MLDFSTWIDLPLVWSIIIGAAIFIYVWLDGFDLGIGILFPFLPDDRARDVVMNSIAPFWDGNETWLVLGGGGLFAAFPLAYAILLPAFYMPIIAMLLGLILRGVAFEFRFKSEGTLRSIWGYCFHFGSLTAAFCQGLILGAFVQGVSITGRHFSGSPLAFASGFSMLTGIALVFGYSLLGSTWIIMKSEGEMQRWSRRTASYVLGFVGIFMGLVSICMPFINHDIKLIWFSMPTFLYLLPIPIATAMLFFLLWRALYQKAEYSPFFLSMGIFLMGYIGIVINIFPWIIPFKFTIWQTAAGNPSLSLLLVGVVPLLPLILGYTGYCYYIFRGKSSHEHY